MNKIIEDMTHLGCTSPGDATLCALTFMELLRKQEAEKVFETTYHYNSTIKKLYCQAKTIESEAPKLFVPISSSKILEPQIWDDYFCLLTEEHKSNSIVLVIWEADGTHVLYELTKGLGSPPREKNANNESLQTREELNAPSTSKER